MEKKVKTQKEPTRRQKEVLDFIREFKKEKGFPPVTREIAAHFKFSVKAAYDHIQALEKKGILTSTPGQSRTLELASNYEDEKVTEIPLLGNIAAGVPLDAEENVERLISVPTAILKSNKDYFALRVQGESMIEAGILDGDIAIIQRQVTANKKDTVAARVNGEGVTLKVFYPEPNRIKLEPRNSEMSPIFSQDVEVLGKLHMIFRSYA